MAQTKIITKENILKAGFLIIKEEGDNKLNARNLAKKLSCSTQPIYDSFKNMNVFHEELVNYVRKFYYGFVSENHKVFMHKKDNVQVQVMYTLEKLEKVISRTEKLNEVINILEPKIQILEEQLMNFSELASLGLTAESVSHEFSSIADRLAERASFYGAKLHGKNITDSDLYVFFEYINSTVNGLKIQLKHLDPTLKYNREKKSEIKLSLFFKEESEYYKNRLQKNSIDFTIFLEDDFSISINRGKIVQIIDNLISNSEYWLIKLKGNDPNCKPSITIKIESPWIYFYDNGYGISPAIENMLFEPFVTTKPKGEGRGLGLFIIQQLLDSSKCTIALEPFRNEHGRKYIFAINFSNIINEYK